MHIACPNCGAQYDASVALADEDARRFFGLMAEMPPIIVRPLIRYLGLFKPAKTRLRWSRMVNITKELLPMIKAAHLKRDHNTYAAPAELWAAAMQTLVESPPASLKLPLKGNGYLLAMLAAQCEQAAAANEARDIKHLRHRDTKPKPGKAETSINADELEKAHERRLEQYTQAQEAKA